MIFRNKIILPWLICPSSYPLMYYVTPYCKLVSGTLCHTDSGSETALSLPFCHSTDT